MYRDRVRDVTTSSGTGAITLAETPPVGYQKFATAFTGPQTVAYCIADQSGPNWEVGTGTFNGTTGLTRTVVLASSAGGAAVAFGAGIKDVFCTSPAAYLLPPGATTQVYYNNAGLPGASANFTYDSGSNTVSFGNITGSALAMTIQPRAPTVLEDAGALTLLGRNAVKANSNGGNILIQAGNRTGAGSFGRIDLTVGTSGVSAVISDNAVIFSLPLGSQFEGRGGGFTFQGSTAGSAADMFFNAGINAAFTGNTPIRFGTDSGDHLVIGESVFGTQELGVFGIGPVARQTTAVATVARVAVGGGNAVDDNDTFGGYTIGQIVNALKAYGLLT